MPVWAGAGAIFANVLGGLFGSSASKDAARIQAAAATYGIDVTAQGQKDALQFQKQQYADTVARQLPWVQTGQAALSTLARLTGLHPSLSPPTPAPITPPSRSLPRPPGSNPAYPGSVPHDPTLLDSSWQPTAPPRLEVTDPVYPFVNGADPNAGYTTDYGAPRTTSLAQMGAGQATTAAPGGGFSVQDPTGGVHVFPTQIQAQAFARQVQAFRQNRGGS